MTRATDAVKTRHLNMMADYRDGLYRQLQLRQLFFELTMRCNERCLHCGSRCGDVSSEELGAEVYRDLIDKVKRDFSPLPMLCITGGEPLLRKEIYDIMGYASSQGFVWGMTTNGTLIDDTAAGKLYDAGMKTVSVSVDGLEASHDAFRRTPGGYRAAIEGVKALAKHSFNHIQVTTVVTHKTIGELDALFEIMLELPIRSWRVINLEPIGRARSLEGYMLTPDDYVKMFTFIRDKRREGYPVEYGCSHYLGLSFEREVRNWYFICSAGIYTASILANGDIAACLDIERRPETIQGNVLRDDFTQVWKDRFGLFRQPLSEKNEKCSKCASARFCAGGAHHSWDYDGNRPLVCFDGVLF
ncbi:MAG: radical SAM protein [Oscillospiraceae bacterium]|nr:radical SAM protein [Oscillospiraceae bacterium]